jgi:hypothetical protein
LRRGLAALSSFLPNALRNFSLEEVPDSFAWPTENTTMSDQKFPPGWDEARVREVLAHYESQTEDEQFAEIEGAQQAEGVTMMAVPTELVPEVRALLAKNQSA